MFRRLASAGLLLAALSGAAHADPRPNIVFILIDDLRWDDLGCTGHPFVKTPHIDRIAAGGMMFANAFCTTPLCSPSRASILTGLYAHRHGIIDNTDRSPASHQLVTFPRLLHEAGYETAFIGKWHMGVDDSPRPGWDHWVSVKGQGAYFDPELNIDGRRTQQSGYVTDIFNQHAIDFLKRPPRRPWLLYLSHKAVHPNLQQRADGTITDPLAGKFEPAERHRELYAGAAVPRRPNTRDTLEGKPALQRPVEGLPPLGLSTGTDDETVRNRLRMLMSVEEGVGRIRELLERQNLLDDTIVVFTSDHGYFYGEHGLSVERRLAYEETIRVPLLLQYPRRIKAGTTSEALVLLVDLAPTLLEMAGVPLPGECHGRSLMPILSGRQASLRQSLLIEHFSDNVFARARQMGYQAVRTERWKLIRYRELPGMDELYDLAADPFELHNRISDAAAQPQVAHLQAELERLLEETGGQRAPAAAH